MRKQRTLLTTTVFFLLSFTNGLFAQQYQVELAAYPEEIDASFFEYAGYNSIETKTDLNDFTHYAIGNFYTSETAGKVQQEAIQNGFVNAHITSKKQIAYVNLEKKGSNALTEKSAPEVLYIKDLKFSTKNLSLNRSLIQLLEETLTILIQNPDLKLRITGFETISANNVQNSDISGIRVRVIQNFLLANGIPAYRLKTKISANSGTDLLKTKHYQQGVVLSLLDLKDEIVLDLFKEGKAAAKTQHLSAL